MNKTATKSLAPDILGTEMLRGNLGNGKRSSQIRTGSFGNFDRNVSVVAGFRGKEANFYQKRCQVSSEKPSPLILMQLYFSKETCVALLKGK